MHLQGTETVVFFGTVLAEEGRSSGWYNGLALVLSLSCPVLVAASRPAGLLRVVGV